MSVHESKETDFFGADNCFVLIFFSLRWMCVIISDARCVYSFKSTTDDARRFRFIYFSLRFFIWFRDTISCHLRRSEFGSRHANKWEKKTKEQQQRSIGFVFMWTEYTENRRAEPKKKTRREVNRSDWEGVNDSDILKYSILEIVYFEGRKTTTAAKCFKHLKRP